MRNPKERGVDRMPDAGPERRRFLREVVDALDEHGTEVAAARALGLNRETYRGRLRTARQEGVLSSYLSRAEPSELNVPRGLQQGPPPTVAIGECRALVMSDIHVPYHDADAVEIALQNAGPIDTVILNGDIIDCVAVSQHERTPAERMGFEAELEAGRKFLSTLRAYLPEARIFYREGNHERRLPRYLARNAPELYALLDIPNLLHLAAHRIQWVPHAHYLTAGKLQIIHGHEYPGGGSVNVARSKFLAALDNVMCGHHHRSQEEVNRTLSGKVLGSWSVGCLCYLYPDYAVRNRWNHGYAIITVDGNGSFEVQNKKILNGRVY